VTEERNYKAAKPDSTDPSSTPDEGAKKTYRLPDGRVVDFSGYADWLTSNLVKSINSESEH